MRFPSVQALINRLARLKQFLDRIHTHGEILLRFGVPVVIGAGGVEKIVEIELDEEAQKNFTVSVDAVKELLEACKAIDSSLAA